MNKSFIAHNPGQPALIFACASATLFWLMKDGPLAEIERISGLRALDLRPSGYTFQDTVELLTALGREGRDLYLTTQLPLDAVYPALMALTFVFTLKWVVGKGGPRSLSRIAGAFAVGAALFDYGENLMIANMLIAWPEINPTQAYISSAVSIAKSTTTTAAILLTTMAFVGLLIARRRS